MIQTDITLKHVFQAKDRIDGMIRSTPMVDSPTLAAQLGRQVHLKLENLQQTGSFKLRGAANALLSLSDAQKKNGVLAFSTENHGILIEGAAAVTLAWLLKNKTGLLGKNVVGILSGGNMDVDIFCAILAKHNKTH